MWLKQNLKQAQTDCDSKWRKFVLVKKWKCCLCTMGILPCSPLQIQKKLATPSLIMDSSSGPVCASLLSNLCYWVDCPVNKSILLSIYISHLASSKSKSLHRQLQVNKSSQEKEAAAEQVLQI